MPPMVKQGRQYMVRSVVGSAVPHRPGFGSAARNIPTKKPQDRVLRLGKFIAKSQQSQDTGCLAGQK